MGEDTPDNAAKAYKDTSDRSGDEYPSDENLGDFQEVNTDPFPKDEDMLADSADVQHNAENTEVAAASKNQPYKKLRVMVIEDDDETMDLFIEYLKEIGVRKIVAIPNANTAYFQITEDIEMVPDVIILELELAGTSGMQFLAKLRAHENEKVSSLPAIVVTMLEGSKVFQRATQKGIAAFIRKPFSYGSLRNALDDAIEGKTVATPEEIQWSWLDELDERDRRAREQAARQIASQQPWYERFWRAFWDT